MQLSSELQTPPRRPVQVVGCSATPTVRESGGPDLPPGPETSSGALDGRTNGSPRQELWD